jgi:hypothetical protein
VSSARGEEPISQLTFSECALGSQFFGCFWVIEVTDQAMRIEASADQTYAFLGTKTFASSLVSARICYLVRHSKAKVVLCRRAVAFAARQNGALAFLVGRMNRGFPTYLLSVCHSTHVLLIYQERPTVVRGFLARMRRT